MQIRSALHKEKKSEFTFINAIGRGRTEDEKCRADRSGFEKAINSPVSVNGQQRPAVAD